MSRNTGGAVPPHRGVATRIRGVVIEALKPVSTAQDGDTGHTKVVVINSCREDVL